MMINNGAHIIFGTGPVGLAVMHELKRRGVQDIRMVNRSGRVQGADRGDIQVIGGDASDAFQTAHICQGASVVYHCAQPGYMNWPKQFPTLTNAIMQGAAAANAKLVYADNLYMYGHVDGPITESLPHKAKGHKGVTRAVMAKQLLDAHKAGKVRTAIGRASDFFGPGVLQSFMGERVFGFALKGKPADVLGHIDMPHTYTYIEDFARGLVTLGQEDRALGEAWHIPSAETVTTRQLLSLLFQEIGSEPKIRATSAKIVSLMSLFSPIMKEMKEIMYEFEQPFVVDHSKFTNAFGPMQTTSHQEAIRRTLSWYRSVVK
ncbi:SDR family oxidoreductase [Paenibacillus hexagrammi]|uniref:SDR family oxidoreductase n=1 Tax=Paenibacillus hexagrammi TaxID=2908839 RepID=A0ABY3SHV4_9BACL|nr:SDR family oxidoreductase [Paenibacillus sp. YPD9-1]UJF33536.1 SDR family oxidoreductase [Paenibacillus sp. YPD9-1]